MSVIKSIYGKLLDWSGLTNIPAALAALARLKGNSGQILSISETDAEGIATAFEAVDKPAGGGNDSGQNPPQDGADGFSPIATVTQTATGATISITDVNGTTTATVTNGKDGKDGVDGKDGKDGYTPQKGVDYFDGQPGKDGKDGADGYTPVKGVDYFDGQSGKDGADGKPGTDGSPGRDGSNGADGKDGFSPIATVTQTATGATISITDVNGTTTATIANGKPPVKGTDYWTEAERAAIIAEVVDSIKVKYPDAHVIYGDVDVDNVITIYGELPKGIYTLKYEDAEGNATKIGTLNIAGVSYDNLADPTSDDWCVDKRLTSQGVLADAPGCQVTNFIPCVKGDVIRVKGLDIRYVDSDHTTVSRAWFYTPGGNNCVGVYPNSDPKIVFDDVDMFTITIDGLQNTASGLEENIASGRFAGILFDGYTAEDVVITVNQEITD